MKDQIDAQEAWYEQQSSYFNSAVGYYELHLLDEAEAELNKMDAAAAADAIPVIALKLGIAYSREEWKEMKALARRLFLLDSSNPKWPYSDGFATAKIDSD